MKTNLVLGPADVAVLVVLGILVVAAVFVIVGFFRKK